MNTTDVPPIAGAADLEYESRIDADRVSAEFATAKRPTTPQESTEDLPLFGGEKRQKGLFE